MPRKGPRAILQPSDENMSRRHFNILSRNIPKMVSARFMNYEQYYMKTVRNVPESLHEGPRTIVQSSVVKNIVPPNFIMSTQNICHHFESLLASF